MSRRIEFHRNVEWDLFGRAWMTTQQKPTATRLHVLRIFGVLILW